MDFWFLAWAFTSLLLLGALFRNQSLVGTLRDLATNYEAMAKQLLIAKRMESVIMDAFIKVGGRHPFLNEEMDTEVKNSFDQLGENWR